MEISQCKKCSYFLSLKGEKVICSYKNSITELSIKNSRDNKVVMNCPKDSMNNSETKNKKVCPICNKNKKETKGCPLCNHKGYLLETTDGNDSLIIPHLSEFRIKAVKIGNKYKIIMLTENNQNLISQSEEYDLDDKTYNKIFEFCKNKIKKN